jgi:hypothetical protein
MIEHYDIKLSKRNSIDKQIVANNCKTLNVNKNLFDQSSDFSFKNKKTLNVGKTVVLPQFSNSSLITNNNSILSVVFPKQSTTRMSTPYGLTTMTNDSTKKRKRKNSNRGYWSDHSDKSVTTPLVLPLHVEPLAVADEHFEHHVTPQGFLALPVYPINIDTFFDHEAHSTNAAITLDSHAQSNDSTSLVDSLLHTARPIAIHASIEHASQLRTSEVNDQENTDDTIPVIAQRKTRLVTDAINGLLQMIGHKTAL